jgi:poly-gamma-glutamate synthesis protein (capsule biosynthesis protein)
MKLLIGADTVPTSVTEDLFIKGNSTALFGDICKLSSEADRVIINLECALTNHDGAIKKFGPNIKCAPECVNGLKALGVTDVMLSNNHVFDFGKKGLVDTLEALDKAGLP